MNFNSDLTVPYQVQVIQGDQKVSVHMMITVQKITSNIGSI
jgi:hypothetical protein